MALIIVLLIAVAIPVLLIIGAWTGIKIWLWRRAVRAEKKKDYQLKHRPDGRPYPPSGRGICDNCGQAVDKVYFMESNQRLCPACYSNSSDA